MHTKEETVEKIDDDSLTSSFLKKYDPSKILNFDPVKFRPGASYSTPFGLDNTFSTLRTHLGVDRGYSLSSIYRIYSPFDIYNASYAPEYGNYGSLLFLPVRNSDFELRIAHIKIGDFQEPFRKIFSQGTKADIISGTYFADAGNYGLSSGTEIVKGKAGAHTHTEVVSNNNFSEILEYILEKKIGKEALNTAYTLEDINAYADSIKSSRLITANKYKEECTKRSIIFLNKYKCIRKDYHTGKDRTFYSSYELFKF